MGLLNIDEQNFQLGLENLVEDFKLVLKIESGPYMRAASIQEYNLRREQEKRTIEELENKVRTAICTIPHGDPKPKEIRDIFRKTLGVDPKIKKTSHRMISKTRVEYRIKTDIMNQPDIWSNFYVRVELPGGFLLTNFYMTFFRKN